MLARSRGAGTKHYHTNPIANEKWPERSFEQLVSTRPVTPRHGPKQATLDRNLYLVYRRAISGVGSWTARVWARDEFIDEHLGQTDDTAPSNEVRCRTFAEAREAALRWRDSLVRTKAGIEAPITVREA